MKAAKRHAAAATIGAVALLTAAACGSSGSPSNGPAPLESTSSSGAAADPSTDPSAISTTGTWPGFHANQARTGAVASGPRLSPATKAWSTDLGAAVYGQPVVAAGRIFAATERNRVVALDPATGKVLWSTSLGAPLTDVDSVAGCGNVDPLGVTSTPVVDTVSGTLFVVGEISSGGTVHRQLEGLDIATGKVTVSDDVDPPVPDGEKQEQLLQRAGLALANGRVYVGYGGNDGDCGHYHGWLVSVAEKGAPDLASFEVAADGEGGAIWLSGGAPAVDSAGNVYVTTGNANPDPPQGGPDPKQYTESAVKLTPALKPVAAYKDRVAGGDEDLASANPVLLPDGNVFVVGKADVGYVLRQSDLSMVASIANVCGSDPDGGPAYDSATNTMFVPCRKGGIQEIDLGARKLGPLLKGANSGPILIGGHVWAAQYPDGTLTEFDAKTGATLQTVEVGTDVPTFASPSAGAGLLLIGTKTGVTAFH